MRNIVIVTGIAALLSACSPSEETPAEPEAEVAATAEEPAEETTGTPDLVPPVNTAPETHEATPAPTSAASLKPRIPLFNATCGNDIEVHADEGGPVFIDGEKTSLKKFNDNYFEATAGGTTISISFNPDDSLGLSFTGPNRANGICTLK